MLLEHLAQRLGDPLRQHHRDLRADAQKFDVFDRTQPAEQPVELVIADAQRIAPRKQHVAHFAMGFEVGQRLLPLASGKLIFAARIPDQARTRAIAAIGRTGPRRQEQDPVWIAVHDSRRDRVVILAERIVGLARQPHILVARHDVCAPQRFERVLPPHKTCVIRRDANRQRPLVPADRRALVLGEFEDAGEFGKRADARAELPVPVIPLGGRCAGMEALIKFPRLRADRKTQRRQPGSAADPRYFPHFFCLFAGTVVRPGTHGPQRRLEIPPPQHLQTHRRLMTLHAPRLKSPSDFPSNGVPARGYLGASSNSSSVTAANTGEAADRSSICHTYCSSIDDRLLKHAQVKTRCALRMPNLKARVYDEMRRGAARENSRTFSLWKSRAASRGQVFHNTGGSLSIPRDKTSCGPR